MNENRATPWLMASMASLVVFALYVVIFAVPPVISTLVQDLDITHEEAGLLMTVFLVVYCIGSLVAGFLSDRLGSKPVMASGLLLASLAGYFFASTVSYPLMLLSRVIIGWGAASIFAPGLKFVLAWLPESRVTTGVARYNMAVAVGSGVPMLLTPILMVSYGWMWPLRFYALFGIVVTIIFWLFTSERKQARTGLREPGPMAAQAGAGLFRNPVLVLVSLALFLSFIQLYGVYTWVPPYLTEVLRLSPAEIGIGTMILAFSAVPGALFTGWLADRTGKGIVIVMGGSLLAASSVLLIALVGAPFWAVAAVCFTTGWGTSMVTIPLFAMSGAAVAPALAGRATGFASTWAFAGGILSSYWGGYAVTTVGRYDAAFVTFAASVLVSGIVVCPFVKRALSQGLASRSSLALGNRL